MMNIVGRQGEKEEIGREAKEKAGKERVEGWEGEKRDKKGME